MRSLAISCDGIDCNRLLTAWKWCLPEDAKPLLIGIFGDWVFGRPDGTHWHLDLLEGRFRLIARDSAEFNEKKNEQEYRDEWFGANWADIAIAHGLKPNDRECLGWKLLPIMGGQFAVENIRVYPLMAYQTITGDIFRQIARR